MAVKFVLVFLPKAEIFSVRDLTLLKVPMDTAD